MSGQLTFEEIADETLLVMHELYPSKEALDGAMASGEKDCMSEAFEQPDELLVALGRSPDCLPDDAAARAHAITRMLASLNTVEPWGS